MASSPPSNTPFRDRHPRITSALNITNAVSNLVNSIIGVGISTLPNSVLLCGVPLAVFFSLTCTVLIAYTSDLMVRTAKKIEQQTGKEVLTYADLCEETIGAVGYYVLALITFLMMFCAMCVYCVLLRQLLGSIISDLTRKLFQYDHWVLVGALVLLALPLCLLPKISKLGSASFLSTLMVFTIIIIVMISSPTYHNLMKTLTKAKIFKLEDKLDVDRAVYICGLSSAALSEISNKLVLDDECSKPIQVSSVLNSVNKSLTIEQLRNITQSHVNHIYSEFSLENPKKVSITTFGVFRSLGIYSSALIIQQATFGIFGQLRRKTVGRWRLVQAIGFPIVYAANIALAMTGYLAQMEVTGDTVFDKMKMRFLTDDAQVDYVINSARILLAITILLTYPMQNYYSRINFFIVFFKVVKKVTGKEYDRIRPPKRFFYPFTLIQFALTLIIGIYLDKILAFYTIMGALFASPLIYIFPAVCFLMCNNSILENIRAARRKGVWGLVRDVGLPLFVLLFGVTMTIISTVVEVIKMAAN